MSIAILSAVVIVITGLAVREYIRRMSIRNKRVLVIGGTSGLGFALAKQLYSQGNAVTITSRTLESAMEAAGKMERAGSLQPIACLALDISLEAPFDETATDFDYIFCMPGFSAPGYLKDQSVTDFQRQMDLNYIAVVRTLRHYRRRNKHPFTFVAASSTAAFFFFPGYGSYAPTKAALIAFAACVRPELRKERIDLKIFVCAAMDTRGLAAEDTAKPAFTRDVEYSNSVMSAEQAAERCLKGMRARWLIATDWFTHFAVIKEECELWLDYALFPLAVLVIFIAKNVVSRKFCKLKRFID